VGLFGSVFKLGKGLVGKAVKIAAPQVSVGLGIAKKLVRRNAKKILAGGGVATVAGGIAAGKRILRTPAGAAAAAAAGTAGVMGMMGGGVGGRRYRRINPGNTRAMRRAIRRIEAGARIYSKFFGMKRGRIKGAPGVHVKKLSIRRAA